MPKILLLDVTNRDGVQTAHLGLAKIEKTIVNMYLNEMGITQSEFGFPTTHHETNYLNANLELADMGVLCPIRLSGWLRAVKKDVEVAYQLVPKLKYLNLSCLLYTSDAADDLLCVDLGGRRILKTKIAMPTPHSPYYHPL
mgnify:CR=1 FL=1